MKSFKQYLEEAQEGNPSKEYGVRWSESKGRNMSVIQKEKIFKTEEQRTKFCEKLEEKPSFVEFLSWHN